MQDSQLLFRFCPKALLPLLRQLTGSALGIRFAHGAFWSISGTIVSRGAGLLVSIPIARILGREGFGEYGIIYSTMVMFSIIVGSGLSFTTSKYVAELHLKDPSRAGRIIALGNLFSFNISLIMALLLVISAPWLAKHAIAAPHLTILLSFSALGVFLNTLNQVNDGTLIGFEAFKSIASRNFYSGIARFFFLLIGAYFWNLAGVVGGFIIAEGFMLILNQLAIWKYCRRFAISVNYRSCLREKDILWKFSGPAALTGAISAPVMWLCNAVLVNGQNGYAEMGLYNMALQWKTFIIFIPLALNNVALPILSDLYGKRDLNNHKKLLKINILFYSVLTGIIAFFIAILSPFITGWYGKEFVSGADVLSIVALSSIFFALHQLMLRTLASLDLMWYGFAAGLLSGIIQIILAIIFTEWGWGAFGLGVAAVFAYLVPFFIQLHFVSIKIRYI